MMTLRKSGERGNKDHGWLNTHHTFSFGNYYDQKHTQYRSLRVMNEDKIQKNRGFGTHAHNNMEIISYVISGELEHKDSIGNGSIIQPGDLQMLSAGSGVTHSEFNPSSVKPAHFYQIWITPDKKDIQPSYQQENFSDAEKLNNFKLVVSPEGKDGTISIHQDAFIYLSQITQSSKIEKTLDRERFYWVQAIKGTLGVGDHELNAGDGLSICEEDSLSVLGLEEKSEVMLFSLR